LSFWAQPNYNSGSGVRKGWWEYAGDESEPNRFRIVDFEGEAFYAQNGYVEVKDEGMLTAVSINYMKYTGLPEPPYAIGIIKLDGADTSIIYTVAGVDLSNPETAKEKLKIGTRVKAVWKEVREGNMKDILYFVPV